MMLKIIWLYIFFSIIFYTILNLKKSFFSIKMGVILLIILTVAAFIAINNSPNDEDAIPWAVLFFIFTYCPIIGIAFNRQLLPLINERIIHLTSIIFLYNVITLSTGYFQQIMLNLAIIPTCIIIYYLFAKTNINDRMKILLYFWFLFMLVIIEIIYFKLFLKNKLIIENPSISLFICVFFLVGLFFYISIYTTSILQVLPFQMYYETEEEMEKRIELHADIFKYKFLNKKSSTFITIIITNILVFTFYLNYIYNFISPGQITEILMIFTLVIYPQIDSFKKVFIKYV